MKRFCIACLTALAALSAQAVTIDWNKDVDWGGINWRGLGFMDGDKESGFYRDIGHIGTTAKAAFRLNVRFPGTVPTAGCLLMAGGTGGGIKLSLAENGLMASFTDEHGTQTIAGSAKLEAGLNQVVLAIDRSTNVEGIAYHSVISIFVNGEKAFSYEGYFGGVTFNKVTVGCDYDLGNAIGTSDWTYNLTYAKSTNSNDNYTGVGDIEKAYDALFLPEPTALGLLALGVAGLALRRKAA